METEHCGIKTMSTHPPKFKIADRYAEHRRKMREDD
ncbi:RNA-protein complex protein Nop10 [Candidatus Micrarchaeota archaeon]|nr:RNA-protein complex protein Nop10 [Candidatus Micrarchaeota archaeon]